MKILVVCAGNTCRSPAAEAAIRSAASRSGLDLDVSSAGTSAERVGAPVTPAMVAAGRAHGIDISGAASQVTVAQLEAVDLILAMDHQTELFLSTLTTATPIELLGGYDPAASSPEIADPFGADDAVYAATLERIIAAADAMVASLSD